MMQPIDKNIDGQDMVQQVDKIPQEILFKEEENENETENMVVDIKISPKTPLTEIKTRELEDKENKETENSLSPGRKSLENSFVSDETIIDDEIVESPRKMGQQIKAFNQMGRMNTFQYDIQYFINAAVEEEEAKLRSAFMDQEVYKQYMTAQRKFDKEKEDRAAMRRAFMNQEVYKEELENFRTEARQREQKKADFIKKARDENQAASNAHTKAQDDKYYATTIGPFKNLNSRTEAYKVATEKWEKTRVALKEKEKEAEETFEVEQDKMVEFAQQQMAKFEEFKNKKE